ncbi:gamma-glutamylcyclotransferase family protein [Marinobacter sp.]|uniref:gamma-glutamylcyclotransferase family protein n=1 Tax=Marinobacter sp. TaxID=50741 RepID=UPI003A944E18
MLCFCYGSNMSQQRLQARVPSARFVAVAELPSHRLRFHKSAGDGSAKCDAEETGNPADRVTGVVYEIADAEKADLDRHEALGFGYDEKQVELRTERGGLQAWMYFATRINKALKPFHWYKDHVLIGARENGLPAGYIAQIEAVESIDDPKPERHERELSIYSHSRASR